MDDLLFQEARGVDMAQAVEVRCPAVVVTAMVAEISGRAHIDTRDVASTAIAVA
jgi:hypothetical protein